jgi:hypothetical protein
MDSESTLGKTITEIIDRLDVVREELFTLQRSLEKIEIIETAPSVVNMPKGLSGPTLRPEKSPSEM